MTKVLPAGAWAIASDIQSKEELAAWMEKASWADAWTFRNPKCSDRETLTSLQILRDQTPWLAVHGRLDWAMHANADALILGSRSLPWEEIADTVKKFTSTNPSRSPIPQIGASVHDPEEVAHAMRVGAEFLVYGPIWSTPSKEGILEPRGLGHLAEICKRGLPVVAIGGIQSRQQAMACLDAGAHAVAVLRAYDRPELTQPR